MEVVPYLVDFFNVSMHSETCIREGKMLIFDNMRFKSFLMMAANPAPSASV